jgi:hypothetical protein
MSDPKPETDPSERTLYEKLDDRSWSASPSGKGAPYVLSAEEAEDIATEHFAADLADLAMVVGEVAKVYDHITGGRISKCNTLAAAVIGEADEFTERAINEAVVVAVQAERDRCEAELGEIYFLMDNHGGCLDPGCPNLEPIAAVIARLDAWALAAIEGVTDE